MPKKKEKVVMLPRPPSPIVGERPSHNLASGTTIRISEERRDRVVARSTRMDQTYDSVLREILDRLEELEELERDIKAQGPEAIRLMKDAAALAKKGRQK